MNKFSHINTWIFDLDDTLYPPSAFSEHMKDTVRSVAAQHLNMTVPECCRYFSELVQRHSGVPFTGLHRESGIDMTAFIKEGFDLDFSLLRPCSASKDILESIIGKKVVFTNSPDCHAKKTLKALEYSHIFDNIYDVTMFDFDSKPNVAPYHYVLNDLKVEASSCLMVEDSYKNLKTAKKLGMTTVYVHGKEDDIDGIIDHRYETLLDFLKDVKNLQG